MKDSGLYIGVAIVVCALLWARDRSEQRCVSAGGDATECADKVSVRFGCSSSEEEKP